MIDAVNLSFILAAIVGAIAFLGTGVMLGRRLRGAEDAGVAAALLAQRDDAERRCEQQGRAAAGLDEDLRGMRAEAVGLRQRLAVAETGLDKDREKHAEKLALVEAAEARLKTAFQATAAEALRGNNESFLALAQATLTTHQEMARGDLAQRQEAIAGLVAPVTSALKLFDEKIVDLERQRIGAYAGLNEQVTHLREGQQQLKSETANLVRALRAPQTRGRWGEIQLRRVVELAGMLEHCDFVEQEHHAHDDGAMRPDLIVRLPGGRSIVIDAKVPLLAYLDSIEASDDAVRAAKLVDHARQFRNHVKSLAAKAYWTKLPITPEFVVMFVPGDPFLSAAAQADPGLMDQSMQDGVVLATPFSLIALLKAVAYGWRQEGLAKNAADISKLGRELHDRLGVLATHWTRVGKGLDAAVDAYNAAVGALETRVLPAGRRFRELQAASGDKEIAPLVPIEQRVRALQAPEMVGAEDEAVLTMESHGHA
ncbi:MAG: DNA recombination protein RmuC [Alphaproteobacteria bacterium]|nr:DNA recombination protein RmuC [Alphaproteobacteria bacterium]